ncbi:MAG: aminofutalosine synthase MqnE [Campylobacteraceae bacterium]|jgi:aminodeoxyfutalosine synthase|nr:aminofutalosine synthase MqnE [Campylobacteraceae bacterium]
MKILEKLKNQKRLNYEDALALYELDLFTLGHFANLKRTSMWGKKVYFNINRHINPTNICKDICKFCAFSANRKNPNPYRYTKDEVLHIVEEAFKRGIKEIHVVSAHNEEHDLYWYIDVFKTIKARFPTIHIKALTAAEVHFLSTLHDLNYEETIEKMIEAGVDSMPGGGAEIFDEKVREYVCKGKVKSNEWLEIHELWHKKGKFSNATMLFGHVEEKEHRIDHMLRLRDVQDRTGGFNAFIPLVYQRDNNYLKVDNFLGSQDILKTIAISRLILDNIPHIKAYWATTTLGLAMVAQEFGADDLDGTIEKEAIQSAGGAKSANGQALQDFLDVIITSGFVPVERDSLYNELKVYEESACGVCQ